MADLHRENHQHRMNHEHRENPENLANPDVSHEQSDVNIHAILGFGAALIVIAAVVHLLIYVLFGYFNRRENAKVPAEYPLAAAQGHREPPEPRLQIDPRQDLADLRAKEDEVLSSYGWVDKNAGLVRIPIDAAVKLTLERGLPARQGKP
jgi:hypothetical protein